MEGMETFLRIHYQEKICIFMSENCMEAKLRIGNIRKCPDFSPEILPHQL